MEQYTLRIATIDDSIQIAALLTSLGHDTSNNQVRSNWRAFTASGNLAYVAATLSDQLVGVITIHTMIVLHRPKPVGRVTALFVDEQFRNLGIGGELLRTAEAELAKSGCGLVEITSNFRLTEAHSFYEQQGYSQTSVRLVKSLPDA